MSLTQKAERNHSAPQRCQVLGHAQGLNGSQHQHSRLSTAAAAQAVLVQAADDGCQDGQQALRIVALHVCRARQAVRQLPAVLELLRAVLPLLMI